MSSTRVGCVPPRLKQVFEPDEGIGRDIILPDPVSPDPHLTILHRMLGRSRALASLVRLRRDDRIQLLELDAGLLIDLLVPVIADAPRAEAGAQKGQATVLSVTSTFAASTPSFGCSCCGTECGSEPLTVKTGLFDLSDPVGKVRAGFRFAWNSLCELGLWILLGVVLGAAVETLVPERTFTQYLGGASLLGLLAALVVAGIFSADSLGPVGRIMGRRTAVVYAVGVVLLAGVFGLTMNGFR